MKTRLTRLLAGVALCLAAPFATRAGAPPVVTNVVTAVNGLSGSNTIVTVSYDISDANFTNVNVFMLVSRDSGATWTVPATQFGAVYNAFGTNVGVTTTPTTKTFIWFAGLDWYGNYTTNCRVRVLANNVGLVLIPPGSYLRGDAMGDPDITDAPQLPVYVSAFYMDSTLVAGGKWGLVKGYADAHGYTFENAGSLKANSHPVQTINWLDAVKWCNARSEMEGITPVYYTDGGYGTVLKTGAAASTTPYWKPGANGYRLPTEAEWEKAARGGANGHRFPSSDTDDISEARANYTPGGGSSYDQGGTQTYATGALPYTSPVGSFPANGYYLYDMAGNVFERCWDWYGPSYYTSGPGALTDPQGPSSGSFRVLRGGSWNYYASDARCANRDFSAAAYADYTFGFRCVRGL